VTYSVNLSPLYDSNNFIQSYPYSLEKLPAELLINIFKFLNKQDHQNLNLTSKKISDLSLLKQIPIALKIIQNKPVGGVIVDYIPLFDRQLLNELLKKGSTTLVNLLDQIYSSERDFSIGLIHFIAELTKYECFPFERLVRLPASFKENFPNTQEIKAVFELAQLARTPVPLEQFWKLIHKIQNSNYLTVLYQGEFIWDTVLTYFMKQDKQHATDRRNLLKFLNFNYAVTVSVKDYAIGSHAKLPLQHFGKQAVKDFSHDREVALAVVRNWGDALQYVDRQLKSDLEIVLAAYEQDPWSLQYASLQIRHEIESKGQLEALKKSMQDSTQKKHSYVKSIRCIFDNYFAHRLDNKILSIIVDRDFIVKELLHHPESYFSLATDLQQDPGIKHTAGLVWLE
jgi:hypothetical protein